MSEEKKDFIVDILPEENEETITLTDDDGKEVDFFQVACIEHKGEIYAILQPAEKLDGFADDEVAIFKILEEDEENDLFLPVDDEKLLDALFEEYLKAVADSGDGET
jgi:uncharacterized protein YrzB (UPF0473 family)